MIHQKIFRQRLCVMKGDLLQLQADQMIEAVFEIAEEEVAALTGEQAQDIPVVLLQVLQQMEKDGSRRFSIGISPVGMGMVQSRADDVGKQLRAQFPEQVILGLKMGIEGGAPHVGSVDDLLHGDFVIALLGEQLTEGIKDRLSGLFLPPVHSILQNSFFGLFRILHPLEFISCFRTTQSLQ